MGDDLKDVPTGDVPSVISPKPALAVNLSGDSAPIAPQPSAPPKSTKAQQRERSRAAMLRNNLYRRKASSQEA